jgi:hypothetical protein
LIRGRIVVKRILRLCVVEPGVLAVSVTVALLAAYASHHSVHPSLTIFTPAEILPPVTAAEADKEEEIPDWLRRRSPETKADPHATRALVETVYRAIARSGSRP